MVLVLGSGVLWSTIFADSTDGTFEYGVVKEWQGTIELDPYPVIRSNQQEFLLVAPFKHGAEDLVKKYVGSLVLVKGSLIYRAGVSMIELSEIWPDSASFGNSEPFMAREWDETVQTLSGEVVDGKCWLGVMNPGEGLLHSACARLCLLGDIPPLFVVGNEMYVLLDEAGLAFKSENGKTSNGPTTLKVTLSGHQNGKLQYAMIQTIEEGPND